MKIKSIKYISIVSLGLLGASSISNAETTTCKDSFAPKFICEKFADITTNFTFGSVLDMFFSIAIAALVVFILFQIVKAIFKWVSKSGDEKERSGAIKSISNAVAAGIALLVLLFVVPLFTDLLNIGGKPNPAYVCYSATSSTMTQANIDQETGALNSGVSASELSGGIAYEGKAKGGTKNNKTADFITLTADNKDTVDFLSTKMYCKDKDTGDEYKDGYVVLKRVGIKK
ncbi:MAG: hypothetical protein WCJ19_00045 [bacterium]